MQAAAIVEACRPGIDPSTTADVPMTRHWTWLATWYHGVHGTARQRRQHGTPGEQS